MKGYFGERSLYRTYSYISWRLSEADLYSFSGAWMPPLFLLIIGKSHTDHSWLWIELLGELHFFISFFHSHTHSAGPHSGSMAHISKSLLLLRLLLVLYSLCSCSLASRFYFIHLWVISSAEAFSIHCHQEPGYRFLPSIHSIYGISHTSD